MRTNKKGASVFGFMLTAIMSLIVIFLAITIGTDIMGSVRDTQTAATPSYAVSNYSLGMAENLAAQGSNIGLIAGMALVLLVLVAMFGKVISGFGGTRI